jgi:poly(3-hydroxybutyrate) depolymerase
MKNLALLLLVALSIAACQKEAPTPGPRERGGILQFDSGPDFQGKLIAVHYFVPAGEASTMPFQIILHGADRNARDYLAAWAQKAREYRFIAIAPEFAASDFSTAQYNEGNFISSGSINPPEKTTFALIDKIFAYVQEELGLSNEQYNLYGHSAGAQFIHRYLQFYDSPKVAKAVAANAGWYTFPDEDISYPYGIKGLFSDEAALRQNFYNQDLTLLLGTADTLRNNNLRVTAQADNQGRNRLERGNAFFERNQNQAASANQNFQWQRVYVEGVGHDHRQMSPAAADFLYQ